MSTFTTVDPKDETPLARYEFHTQRDLATRVAGADAAHRTWRKVPVKERLALIATLGDALQAAAPRLGAIATQEMGKPLAEAVKEVEKCALACRYYAAEGEAMLAPIPAGAGSRSYVAFEALGPILCIMPWNFPYWQVVRFAIPSLAVGNTVLMKHAENTTGAAFAFEALVRDAGFPAGALQVVLADHERIPALINDPSVHGVTLTGSERAGRAVAAAAGQALKKSVLELGGSDAYVVLEDADVEAAAAVCVAARLVNGGQSCVAAKRFIVHQKIYDRFAEAFIEKAKKHVVGDPTDPRTTVGPLAKASIRDGVDKQVRASVAAGAKRLLGAEGPRGGKGFFYPVSVLGDVVPGMPAFDEEVFGPVAALVRAKDEAEQIQLANRSRYGLGGAVFSRDAARAERLAREELEAGLVAVNGQVASEPRLPFGGVKSSGYGRELGLFGLREFVNVKTVIRP